MCLGGVVVQLCTNIKEHSSKVLTQHCHVVSLLSFSNQSAFFLETVRWPLTTPSVARALYFLLVGTFTFWMGITPRVDDCCLCAPITDVNTDDELTSHYCCLQNDHILDSSCAAFWCFRGGRAGEAARLCGSVFLCHLKDCIGIDHHFFVRLVYSSSLLILSPIPCHLFILKWKH